MTYIFLQPVEQYNLQDMKHSSRDKDIEQARRLSLETADSRKNSHSEIVSNFVNVLQQNNCVMKQESSSENKPARSSCDSHNVNTNNAQQSAFTDRQNQKPRDSLKLPGTSVRHMQRKSQSMSPDVRSLDPGDENVENDNPGGLKRCASMADGRTESCSPTPG